MHSNADKLLLLMVRVAGLEPAWPCDREILSLLRLPVPPHPRKDQASGLAGIGPRCRWFFLSYYDDLVVIYTAVEKRRQDGG